AARGQVRVLHVPSRYQYAGIFTKGLPSTLFEEFRTSLSVRPSPAQTAGPYIAYPTPHALLSVSPSTWHQRLGHPGEDVLRSLKSRQYISYNKEKSSHLCHACQLGKHVRLPFTSSDSIVTRSFEIVHSDIWTSPIASSGNIYLQQSHKDLPRSVRRTDAFLCKSLAEATKRTIFHINE
ncbi:ribonuclease H-like domain-containing protein, partial [Tanacetum coccineum]